MTKETIIEKIQDKHAVMLERSLYDDEQLEEFYQDICSIISAVLDEVEVEKKGIFCMESNVYDAGWNDARQAFKEKRKKISL